MNTLSEVIQSAYDEHTKDQKDALLNVGYLTGDRTDLRAVTDCLLRLGIGQARRVVRVFEGMGDEGLYPEEAKAYFRDNKIDKAGHVGIVIPRANIPGVHYLDFQTKLLNAILPSVGRYMLDANKGGDVVASIISPYKVEVNLAAPYISWANMSSARLNDLSAPAQSWQTTGYINDRGFSYSGIVYPRNNREMPQEFVSSVSIYKG